MGTTDAPLLARTRDAVEGMDGAAPRSMQLSTLADARMRRTSHHEHLLEAKYPGEITYVDAYACGKHGMPVGLDGDRSCMRYAVLFVDGKSRHRRVYFSIPRVTLLTW
jgi:hypothetical protein